MKYNLILIFTLSIGVLILYGILGGIHNKEGLTPMENIQQNISNIGINSTEPQMGTTSQNNTTSFDNYNHYKGASLPTTFYSSDGGKLIIKNSETEGPSLNVVNNSGKSIQYKSQEPFKKTDDITKITFYGDDGGVATIIQPPNGEKLVVIKTKDGSRILYSEKYNIALTSGNNKQMDESNHNNTLSSYHGMSPLDRQKYDGDGDYDTNGNKYNNLHNRYDDNNNENYNNNNNSRYDNRRNRYDDNYSTDSQSDERQSHADTLPVGIAKNRIKNGQEDLYILKSQIVPPVCPMCNPAVIYKDTKCQPCPSCERCPEPSFDCRKVPNYNATNNQYLPIPVLNDFSGFGM